MPPRLVFEVAFLAFLLQHTKLVVLDRDKQDAHHHLHTHRLAGTDVVVDENVERACRYGDDAQPFDIAHRI